MPTKIILVANVMLTIFSLSFEASRVGNEDSMAGFVRSNRVRMDREDKGGNACPETAPWPCKTPNQCLSFDFICDGKPDCPDQFDEDSAMCIAKDRPAKIYLAGFINKYKSWLIPEFLGNKDINTIATELTESENLKSFAKNVELTSEQLENLDALFKAIERGRHLDLLMLGMPESAWNELYILFIRIVKSGFLGTSK